MRGVPRCMGHPAAGFGGPLRTGHPGAWGTAGLGLGSPVPGHPGAQSTPILSLGSLVHGVPPLLGLGSLMHGAPQCMGCWIWNASCFRGVPNAGELSPCLVWGGCWTSCCTLMRGTRVPWCGVPLGGYAAPASPGCRSCPLPCPCLCLRSRQLLCGPTPAQGLGAPALCAALFPH